MAGRVIQGFFIGGAAPRLPAAARATAVLPRPQVGAPQPAHRARPAAAQPFGGSGSFAVDPGEIGLARSGGKALPSAVLAKMEAAFNADFSAVRIHIGHQAARIGALAFTTGNDIYFAPGRYQPDSRQGQQLLGHELTHVIQQRQGRVRAPIDGVAVVQDRALEAEADRLGMRAAMHIAAAPRGPLQAKLAQPGPPRALERVRPPAAFLHGTRAVQRSSAAVSTYTLSADKPDTVALEKYGQFVFKQGFVVTPATAGIIVQRIRRKLTVYEVWGANNTAVTKSTVEGYASCKNNLSLSGWEDYYEWFEVDSKGKSVDLDGFILTQINPDGNKTSAGQYEISGEAYFVPGNLKPSGDWKAGDKNNPAAGLPFIQIAGSASSASLPASQSNTLTRTVKVTWYKGDQGHLALDGKMIDGTPKSGVFTGTPPIKP